MMDDVPEETAQSEDSGLMPELWPTQQQLRTCSWGFQPVSAEEGCTGSGSTFDCVYVRDKTLEMGSSSSLHVLAVYPVDCSIVQGNYFYILKEPQPNQKLF